jgi:hypothetical protein
LDLWLGCCQNWACICPTSEPKSWLSPSTTPINILLVHTIILHCIHMMMIDGCYRASSGPFGMRWVGFVAGMLSKLGLHAQLLSPNPDSLHIHNTNQYPASPYHHSIWWWLMVVRASSGPFGMRWVGFVAGMLSKLGLHLPNFWAQILTVSIHNTNQYPASPYHHPSMYGYDDDWWLLGHHLAHLVCAGLDLWLGCCQTLVCICPTSEPKSWQSPSTTPINIRLVDTIILQCIHMMMIEGC